MIVVDEGRQMVPDERGGFFEAFVTAAEVKCQHCDKPLRGRNVVSMDTLAAMTAGPASAVAFRLSEDRTFMQALRRELEEHERKHWWLRFWKWLARRLA